MINFYYLISLLVTLILSYWVSNKSCEAFTKLLTVQDFLKFVLWDKIIAKLTLSQDNLSICSN